MCTYMGLPQWLSGKESACNAGAAGDVFLIPGSERSPGGGHGNPLRSSCLENHRTEKPRRHRVTESDMTEATSHTHTHTHSTLTQRTVSGNLCCHHPLPYVAPGIQVDVVEFQPLAMAEGPWCWDWMPTPKCPSIKQLEPPIRLMSTSLLVYLETSELAEYTPLRLWSLSGPSLSHFLVYEEQHLGGGGGWRPHIPAPLVKRGLTYTSFHALSF